MPAQTWKADERWFAEYIGTHRTPLSGSNSRHTHADTLHEELFLEVKRRKKHSLVELFRKTAKLAEKENKIPVVCPVMPRGRERLIMLDIRDIHDVAQIIRASRKSRRLRFKSRRDDREHGTDQLRRGDI